MHGGALIVAGAALWRVAALALLVAATLGILVAVQRGRTSGQTGRGLLGHVAELRNRILWGLASWTAATLLVLAFRLEPTSWGWRPVPALHDNAAAQVYRAMARLLVPADVQLVVLRPLDGFNAELTVALALGFVLALPVLWWQVAAFVGPALHARERRTLRWALLPAMALFTLGATFAVGVMAPLLLRTLYGYPGALGAAPFLLVGELVGFVVTLALIFGLACLTPVAMAGLAAAGLATWRSLLRYWRHATVAILFLCALVTDGTIITLAFVALPLIGLYFAGVGAAAWFTPKGTN